MKTMLDTPLRKPPLDNGVRLHLGVHLQKLFAETARQPIPDRFAILLDRLESGESVPSPDQSDGFKIIEAGR